MNKRILFLAIALCSFVVIGALAYSFYKHQTLLSLYDQALGYETYEAHQAIAKLSGYKNEDASVLLILVSQNTKALPSARIKAIEALRGKNYPPISSSLALILKPQEGSQVRRAIIETIEERECDVSCTTFVLTYLEDVWHGAPRYEDTLEVVPEVEQYFQDQQAIELQNLINILRKSESVKFLLTDVAGLGTADPGPFSIYFAGTLEMKEFCSPISKSIALVEDSDVRTKLEGARSKIGCK